MSVASNDSLHLISKLERARKLVITIKNNITVRSAVIQQTTHTISKDKIQYFLEQKNTHKLSCQNKIDKLCSEYDRKVGVLREERERKITQLKEADEKYQAYCDMNMKVDIVEDKTLIAYNEKLIIAELEVSKLEKQYFTYPSTPTSSDINSPPPITIPIYNYENESVKLQEQRDNFLGSLDAEDKLTLTKQTVVKKTAKKSK